LGDGQGRRYPAIVDTLLASDEPSNRLENAGSRAGESSDVEDDQAHREGRSELAARQKLLQYRNKSGQIVCAKGAYAKWQGANWILATLSDSRVSAGGPGAVRRARSLLDEWLDRFFTPSSG